MGLKLTGKFNFAGTSVYTPGSEQPAATDPYFGNVGMLITGRGGADGAANNVFLDSGPSNYTLVPYGTPTQGSVTPYSISGAYSPTTHGGSLEFDGASRIQAIPATENISLSGDFTIDFWIRATSPAVYSIPIGAGSSGKLQIAIGLSTSAFTFGRHDIAWDSSVTHNIQANTWAHIALVRTAGTIKCYTNGVLTGQVANNINYIIDGTAIGGHVAGFFFTGSMTDVRIVKDVAVYTADFQPPTSPVPSVPGTVVLLRGNNGAIVDASSTSNIKLVGPFSLSTASAKYGTSSVLSTGGYATFKMGQSFGTQDFTVETWFNPTSVSGNGGVFHVARSLSYATVEGISLAVVANKLRLYYAGSSVDTSHTMVANVWTHIAVVRASGVTKVYANGVQVFSAPDTTNYTESGALLYSYFSDVYTATGYMQDFRITTGIARYTSNFVPPEQALPTQ